ncbi:MAG TPA: hypothetical protein PK280_15640 [Planctomycetota bacterium]|nr:hypothetical protein [Planctomycetota bacterium]
MPVETMLCAVLALMVLGAVAVAVLRETLSAVIASGLVGLGGALAFLLLGHPWLAALQASAQGIAAVILLRSAAVRDEAAAGRARGHSTFAAAVGLLAAGVILAAAAAVCVRRERAPDLLWTDPAPSAAPGAPTGAGRPPTAPAAAPGAPEAAAFRAWDTVGLMAALLAAVAGTAAVLRRKEPANERDEPAG